MALKINGLGVWLLFGLVSFLVLPHSQVLVLESADPLYAQWSLFRLQKRLFLLVSYGLFWLESLGGTRVS